MNLAEKQRKELQKIELGKDKVSREKVQLMWDANLYKEEESDSSSQMPIEKRPDIPWFTAPLVKQGWEQLFGYFDGVLETKSGKPWYTK